jgi:hypothetical protein
VDESPIRKWNDELKDNMRIIKEPKQTLLRGVHDAEEAELADWILKQRLDKKIVSMKLIYEQAKILINSKDPSFKASSGWFSNFKKRYRLSRRMPTHKMQKIIDINYSEINKFFADLQAIKYKNLENEFLFINFDETPMLLDMLAKHTYDEKGKKKILVYKNYLEKMRFTILVTATSKGHILPPIVIFKSKTAPALSLINKVRNFV